jgi:hypothetical protein
MRTTKTEFQYKLLSELAEVLPGYNAPRNEVKQRGKYLLLGGRNVKGTQIVLTDRDRYIDEVNKPSFCRAIPRPGDIIVSLLWSTRKVCTFGGSDPRAVVNSSCAIVRASSKNDYIASYLRSETGRKQFMADSAHALRGATIRRLTLKDLGGIRIPIIPLADSDVLGDDSLAVASSADLVQLRNRLVHMTDAWNERRARAVKGTPFAMLDAAVPDSPGSAALKESFMKSNPPDPRDEEIWRLKKEIEVLQDRLAKVDTQIAVNQTKARLANGETRKLEFKSSLRWNLRAGRDDEAMTDAVLKTIAAFCNSEGGDLLIGVDDAGQVTGLEHDHFPNADKFVLHLVNLARDRFTPSAAMYVNPTIEVIDGKNICVVACQKSTTALWVRLKQGPQDPVFCVREGPSSQVLPGPDAVRYIREHNL